MAKLNKPVIRVDPEFDRLIKSVLGKNLMRGKSVKTPRVTRAITNQYKKYPNLLKELEDADLK